MACIHCGHPVANGGDRHAKDRCPPKAQPGNNRAARKRAKRPRPAPTPIAPVSQDEAAIAAE